MKGKIRKEVGIGFIIGILANTAGSYLYIFFLSQIKKLSVESTLKISLEQGLIGNIIVLGALLNFVAFFVFLKKKQYYRARGVIMATLVAAIFIVTSKFF